eukprot:scaffold26342_cov36-Cyclotella_meneghiniana.AAC.1
MLRTIPSKKKGRAHAISSAAARAKGHNNTISKQSSTAQLRPRIISRSIRGVNNEGSVGYLAADEPRSVDSAVSMMCRDSSITNATTRQSTVRWR